MPLVLFLKDCCNLQNLLHERIMKKFILFISVLLLVSGCASKRFTKQASKFEQAGLYEDAAEYYYKAVAKKNSNVEAKLGLRKNGQLTLEKKLAEFMTAYNGANYQEAVYKYKDAESYHKKLKTVGVDLNFPESYKAYYDEAKDDFLNKKYAEGTDKLNREDFSGAKQIFDEILAIDVNYKDVKEKNTIAKYEPVYREALGYLETGFYRKAYYKFNEILAGTGGYKQASALKDEALEKGTITILVTDFTSTKYAFPETANSITSKAKGEIGKLSNPFIKIIDPSTVNKSIYDKGKINMQAANLAGIKAIISGNVSEVTKTEGKLTKTTKRGYIKEVTIVKNEAGQEVEKINWHKIEYTEFEIENKAKLNCDFKMVSTLNGEVLVSDVFNISNSDKTRYAKYDGEKKNLVPGYWKYKDKSSPEDVIKNNTGDINALKQLMNARQTIKPTTSLIAELIDHVAEGISQKVDNFNPENK
jgi:tetratricopeptide (TPR) repeat protein